jgi:hypothetical protein
MPLDEVRLDLKKDALDELDGLARVADKLKLIVTAAADIPPHIGTLPVARLIAVKLDTPVWELRPILGAILNFYRTSVNLELNAAGTAEAISRNLSRIAKSEEDKSRLRTWEAAKERIVEAASLLLPDHPLVAAQKALRVAAARQYELVDTRIFTEARPVFNEAGDAIIQTVITHVLSLDYHDGHSHRVMQFNLDAVELAELGKLCERAARKAAVIKRDLKTAPWPTFIFREPAKPDDSDNQE